MEYSETLNIQFQKDSFHVFINMFVRGANFIVMFQPLLCVS